MSEITNNEHINMVVDMRIDGDQIAVCEAAAMAMTQLADAHLEVSEHMAALAEQYSATARVFKRLRGGEK